MVALVPQVEPEVLALAQQEEPAVALALVEALVEPEVPVLAQEPQAVAEWLLVPAVQVVLAMP